MPRFSVVMAVYNKEDFLEATIGSVLSQSFYDFELVIYNDGSTDNSKAIIERINDKRIRYFEGPNRGAGAARNAALSKAGGELIALLDADDIWQEDHLMVLNGAINAYPEHRVFATDSDLLQDDRRFGRTYSGGPYTEITVVDFFEASLIDSVVNSSTLAVYPEVLEKAGGYNPDIQSGQDTDLWVRIGLHYPVVFIPKVTVSIIRDWGSLSRRSTRMSQKTDFSDYAPLEKDRPGLKKFLDRNRFSLSMLAKMDGDTSAANKLRSGIDKSSLTSKQRFLLSLPGSVLRMLFRLKYAIEKRGWRLSSYK